MDHRRDGGGARALGTAALREAGQPRFVHRGRQGVRRGGTGGRCAGRLRVRRPRDPRGVRRRAASSSWRSWATRRSACSRAGEIIASREFYDYEDKYLLGLAETIAPTDLTEAQLDQAQRSRTAAYRALRVEGLARVDLFLGDDDEIVVNEVNTMPGFTPISMFPMLWEAEGLPFRAVVEELVGLARVRDGRRYWLRTHRVVEGEWREKGFPDGAGTRFGHDRCRSVGCSAHPFCTVRSVVMTFEGFQTRDLGALPGASRLTMAQREAIESDEPLLCVVAGAGAGKTRVLTLRVARRVREGSIEADRTLVTTFSRKAAEELRTRLWSLGVSGVKAGTFHRTALGLLREHRELRGRPPPSSCRIAVACWPR